MGLNNARPCACNGGPTCGCSRVEEDITVDKCQLISTDWFSEHHDGKQHLWCKLNGAPGDFLAKALQVFWSSISQIKIHLMVAPGERLKDHQRDHKSNPEGT